MQLKRIRVIGFKSFADETLIEPGAGITAVVGPNGCGKSNIVDAIRWVLGEKSARGLRAKSMEDVIFLGSESRKPAGMAEVELFFDNRSRMLDIDTDEVTVQRRIYLSSSGSEYYLNDKRTTRRELERVFMDTGIGKSAYSIMEQGRMSEILKASPEERRSLFDEAAGVSRYKAERQETLEQLSRTEQNLLRLGDILKGKKEEIENLERQAKKTRQYLKLKEIHARHDQNIRYLNYRDYSSKKRVVEDKLAELIRKREELLKTVAEREERIERMEAESVTQSEQMHRLDREFHQAISRMDSIQKNIGRFEEVKSEQKQRFENLQSHRQAEDRANFEIKKKLQTFMQLELDLESEIKALRDSSAHLTRTIEKLNSEILTSQEKELENNREIKQIETLQDSLLESLKNVTENLIVELETRKKELAEKERERTQLRDSIIASMQEGEHIISLLIQKIKEGDSSENILQTIQRLNLTELLLTFNTYQQMDDNFRSSLFGESGLLAKKEELDTRMVQLASRRDEINRQNNHLFEKRKLDTSSLEKERSRKVEMEIQIRDFQVRMESSVQTRESAETQLKESSERVRFYDDEIQALQSELTRLTDEESAQKNELADIRQSSKEQTDSMEVIKKHLEKLRLEIHQLKERARKERDSVEKLLPDISSQERAGEGIAVNLSTLQEDLYNDYRLSPSELSDRCQNENFIRENEESEFRRIRTEIQQLGQFNALAIEELERAGESYRHSLEQKKDIEDARKNIENILEDIDQKSRTLFLETFAKIEANFLQVFSALFGGGKATLTLTDEKSPMTSGINIMVQPPGKKNSSITLLSGGEQNMTAVALMFATYLVRPSPFCLLDEIDAPLDDNNVKRFLRMLEGFASKSQFLVITHNKLTMSEAGSIFGVTQEEAGVSKIVSVRLKEESAGVEKTVS